MQIRKMVKQRMYKKKKALAIKQKPKQVQMNNQVLSPNQ